MTIARRLILLLAVPLLILVSLGVVARIQLTGIEDKSRFVAETQIASLAALGRITRSLTEMRVNVRSYLLATDRAKQDQARALFDEDEAALTQLLREFADTLRLG